jgi:hypothetical protein
VLQRIAVWDLVAATLLLFFRYHARFARTIGLLSV